MGFAVARYKRANQVKWGVVSDEKIIPIAGNYLTLADFLKKGMTRARAAAAKTPRNALALSKVSILSPVTSPCKIICQGKNYYDHMVETGTRPSDKDFNLFFSKADSALSSAHGNIFRPEGVQFLDYEIELGLVIGKKIDKPEIIRESSLGNYIAALVIVNDISARAVQITEGQWFKGKSYRTFCPVGPWLFILEKNDYKKLSELNLLLTVNGQKRQEATTAQMMYPPHETLTELSQVIDLEPGDLVSTGTPAGVAMQRRPANLFSRLFNQKKSFLEEQANNDRYLREGDIVRAYIYSDDRTIDLGKQELQVISQ